MNYLVHFIKKAEEIDKKDEYLGSVIIDDVNVNEQFTLISKAFRHASNVCLLADKVKVEKLYNK